MITDIKCKKDFSHLTDIAIVITDVKELNDKSIRFKENEVKLIRKKLKISENNLVSLQFEDRSIFIKKLNNSPKDSDKLKEAYRKAGFEIQAEVVRQRIEKLQLFSGNDNDLTIALLEGLILSNYSFLKYKSGAKKNGLKELSVLEPICGSKAVNELLSVMEAVYLSRDLVNEPLSYLTAECLGNEIKKHGKTSGYTFDVYGKEKIASLKLSGLLAVNKGSQDPPTFSILEWKPSNGKVKNKQPIVLVGKGVVYDTGGLSLKPTKDSMDKMKSDMAGAAAVIGAMYAIAKNKLPVHVIALIPATDNRPGENAYVPGDIIKMHNGITVEVLNTDAEGRIILADALSYAKKYKPELLIDLATLTGSSARFIGHYGIVGMGTADEKHKNFLSKSGNKVYERIAWTPFWDEYETLIESDIADIKNSAGAVGASMTAGKFLEKFTSYPWIHLDIAGPAFTSAPYFYMGNGGTGIGVRLLYDFIKTYN